MGEWSLKLRQTKVSCKNPTLFRVSDNLYFEGLEESLKKVYNHKDKQAFKVGKQLEFLPRYATTMTSMAQYPNSAVAAHIIWQ